MTITDQTFQFALRGIVQSAVDKARVAIPDAERDRIVDCIMASAEWQRRATAIWGPTGPLVSVPPAPDASQPSVPR